MSGGQNGYCYKKILLEGIVQGVGFRPFVYKTAMLYGISGSVANKGGVVEVFAFGECLSIERFIDKIKIDAPLKSKIERITVSEAEPFRTDGFSITESGGVQSSLNRFVSPDLSICDECRHEIFDNKDRRFGHFFNSCVNCGPRFSIIERLPYDRWNTSMKGFPMCKDCGFEYTSQKDRRFHAETICCPNCGPVLSYTSTNGVLTDAEAFIKAVSDLQSGQIIAVKGIGGYHLACSPFDEKAVAELRSIKKRYHKPFAVMFRDISEVRKICTLSKEDESLLISDINPIVIANVHTDLFQQAVLQGNRRCGCFLPYTPLHSLLLDKVSSLIMTSANISGSPIIIDDGDMIAFLEKPYFAGILGNNRKIVRGVDDSVAQINVSQSQIIRAARSIAPKQFTLKNTRDFLAVGGDLKSSFCYVRKGYAYVSQYFGDLENSLVYDKFKTEIESYASLFDIKPKFVVCDPHPQYFSTSFAESLDLPVFKVQHHTAHAASVFADHGFYGDAIAVCFDGTGYGDDGCIWGGEFFIYEKNIFKRAGHLRYIDLLGMDSASKDAKKTALCYLFHAGAESLNAFDERADIVMSAVNSGLNTIKTSSAGRLFDAVSAILGICDKNEYEGQCAVGVQQAAESAVKKVPPLDLRFNIKLEDNMFLLDPTEILLSLYDAAKYRNVIQAAALGFHIALADAISRVCSRISEKTGIRDVVLSGGVFQNSLLTELTVKALEKNALTVLINRHSPPNDSGIAVGQAYLGGLLCV